MTWTRFSLATFRERGNATARVTRQHSLSSRIRSIRDTQQRVTTKEEIAHDRDLGQTFAPLPPATAKNRARGVRLRRISVTIFAAILPTADVCQERSKPPERKERFSRAPEWNLR